ncbi:Receptor-type tyrosine-protein phosphatase N2 [Tupaia chinensis]|uniref:Receptor-type tyrosine-protein phosphatase N2 n=1 Tax=Tupaia chinensis TaxID=246437 RepID=L9L7W7_TUPCH|nr:Receptor-type tyrosine-protein phosphatase N2 [Tupaia chinensis]
MGVRKEPGVTPVLLVPASPREARHKSVLHLRESLGLLSGPAFASTINNFTTALAVCTRKVSLRHVRHRFHFTAKHPGLETFRGPTSSHGSWGGGPHLGPRASCRCGKDGQELCRQRMAPRPPDRPEGPHTSRISSVSSQLSDGPVASPSARSTSSWSWSEEPVQPNMDISTGHVILAYMEDHLKNKNRLEKEWEALCNYQAEPGSSLVAQREENVLKNRSLAVLTSPELLPESCGQETQPSSSPGTCLRDMAELWPVPTQDAFRLRLELTLVTGLDVLTSGQTLPSWSCGSVAASAPAWSSPPTSVRQGSSGIRQQPGLEGASSTGLPLVRTADGSAEGCASWHRAARAHGSLSCPVLSPQMDHDPRNPAYIATQGPLPATVADFWQTGGLGLVSLSFQDMDIWSWLSRRVCSPVGLASQRRRLEDSWTTVGDGHMVPQNHRTAVEGAVLQTTS